MEPDFRGYATKADTPCTDGRTITEGAFAHQDKIEVPLVWQHQHDNPENILGHVVLEHRDSSHPDGAGIYCEGYFNPELPHAVTARALVHNKDVKALSIYANGLIEKVRGKAREVLHGAIQEVSIVVSGANPGAFIDNITLRHSDGEVETLDEAYIYNGFNVELPEGVMSHADDAPSSTEGDGETDLDIYNGLSEKEKAVVHSMIGAAIVETQGETETGGEAEQADATGDTMTGDAGDTNNEGDLTHQEGSTMTVNLFDEGKTNTMSGVDTSKRLTHGQLVTIVENAKKTGSFKEAVLIHAGEYGIDNIELLFPDAQSLTQTPEWISRRMEWVSTVINGTKHSPFAKVKTLFADITAPEARAKGYIKGKRKEEEVFGLLRRTTGPATIYKKQKLDRDDILDITDINVVNWLKAEMRLMIEEEIARAILVGDGRSNLSDDKVKDPAGAIDGTGIRSILNDDDLYTLKFDMPSNVTPKDAVKKVAVAMDDYRGSGAPTYFTSRKNLTAMLLEEDKFGRPLYESRGALADKLGVAKIETVDLFDEYDGLFAIIVSLQDYTVGTNRGGELTSFEDFDIDFNQYKYLQETRLSGGLTKPFSAIVIRRMVGTAATPTQPSFDGTTNVITIPAVTGVQYLQDGDEVAAGARPALTEPSEITAIGEAGYYIPTGVTKSWTYTP